MAGQAAKPIYIQIREEFSEVADPKQSAAHTLGGTPEAFRFIHTAIRISSPGRGMPAQVDRPNHFQIRALLTLVLHPERSNIARDEVIREITPLTSLILLLLISR